MTLCLYQACCHQVIELGLLPVPSRDPDTVRVCARPDDQEYKSKLWCNLSYGMVWDMVKFRLRYSLGCGKSGLQNNLVFGTV